MSTPALDTSALDRWRASPAAFIEECLVNPETGKPFELLLAERAFLKHALTIGPDGRLLYPELVYGAPKKSGKTVFAAILLLTVVLLYGGRNAEGYIAANDFEQAQGRVFEMCRRIIEASRLLKGDARSTADRIVFSSTGATITALTSNAASAAGGHPTIAVFDELWGFVNERSRRLFDELVPVPTRRISCRLVTTYAGFSGESQLLEQLYQRGMEQPLVGDDLHAGDGILMFWSHVPIASWQDEAWLAQMRRSLRPAQFQRMIENRWVAAAEAAFVDITVWDRCVTGPGPLAANRSLPVYVGVDASTKRDSTAVVAVTWDKAAKQARLVAHRVFNPSPDAPVSFEAVEAALLDLHRRFSVRKVLFDPWAMQASAERLKAQGLRLEEFPQTASNLTAASSALFELLMGGNFVLYPDGGMRAAVSHAVAIEGPRGARIGKTNPRHKVDVVVALAMAAHAALQDQGKPRGFLELTGWQDTEPQSSQQAEAERYMRDLRGYVFQITGHWP
jgi:phage terminase large subunit-like protein